MGGGNSSATNYEAYKNERPLSNAEIRQKIDQLFLNNNQNMYADTSIGTLNMGDVEASATEVSPANIANIAALAGGNLKPRYRTPVTNPTYPQYEIDFDKLAQAGGNPQSGNNAQAGYSPLSELSEFDKLKNYLISNMGEANFKNELKKQMGGELEDMTDADIDDFFRNFDATATPATPIENRDAGLNLFLKTIQRGGQYGGEDDEFDDIGVGIGLDDEFEEEFGNFSMDGGANYSETSYQSRSSDVNVNVLPFYSTSSSSDYSFRHPYVRNRFN